MWRTLVADLELEGISAIKHQDVHDREGLVTFAKRKSTTNRIIQIEESRVIGAKTVKRELKDGARVNHNVFGIQGSPFGWVDESRRRGGREQDGGKKANIYSARSTRQNSCLQQP